MEWCAMITRFPFFMYLVAEILTSGWPKLNSSSVRSVASSESSLWRELLAPMLSIRLSLAFEAAFEV